jgi:hypothetical protein
MATTANASAYSAAFTAATGALLVAFVKKSGSVDAGTLTDPLAGGTYSPIKTILHNTSADSVTAFVRNSTVAATTTSTLTYACVSAATGCIMQVAQVATMTRSGLGAIRQSQGVNNVAVSTSIPTAVFTVSCLTGNPTLGVVGNVSNPPTLTAPTSWTEVSDTGYATPSSGAEYVTRDSGFTGVTVAWGNSSASPFGIIVLELDTTDQQNSEVTEGRMSMSRP